MFPIYPYINVNDLNLDYLLKSIKEIQTQVEYFVSLNAIKYANPIQWDITRQYEKNTIVIDPQTGTAYISVAPVPIGAQLNRPEYWTVVFDLGSFVVRASKNFAINYESDTTTTATFNTATGGWLVWGDVLYIANVNITAGDSYVDGGNISHLTMEEIIGHLSDLLTTNKDSIVDAINELYTALNNAVNALSLIIGDLNDLTTVDKTSVVNAINELVLEISNIINIIGDLNDLTTTDASSVVNAINEVNANVGALNGLTTTDKTSVVNAINELVSGLTTTDNNIGDLNDLNTSDKSSIVNAINDIVSILPYVPYSTPQDYGAVADGITDDTTAIQNCIDNNEFIIFPEGTYKCTEITLSSNKYLLGQNAIIEGAYASGTRVFSGNNINNVIIDNIKFKGEGYDNTSAAILNCFTLHFDDSDSITIRNCELYDTQDRGVLYFSDCSNIKIYDNKIHDYPYSGTIFMCGCHDCWYERNHIYNFGSTAELNTYGMSMAGYMSGYTNESYNMYVCNNIIETPLCIWEGIDGHGVKDYVVSGNTIKGTKTPIVISSAINPSGYGNARGVISNNVIYGGDASGSGIQIYNGDCVNISNNIIEHCCKGTGAADGVGIDVRTTKNLTIGNNTIKDCGRSGATNQIAVIYLQGIIGFKVSDNLICDNYVHSVSGGAFKFEVSFYNGDISGNKIYNSGPHFICGTDGFTPTNEIANVKTHNNDCDTYTSYYINYIVVERQSSISGEYEGLIGDIVMNSNPSVGNPIGWICTASKTALTPATWTALANL